MYTKGPTWYDWRSTPSHLACSRLLPLQSLDQIQAPTTLRPSETRRENPQKGPSSTAREGTTTSTKKAGATEAEEGACQSEEGTIYGQQGVICQEEGAATGGMEGLKTRKARLKTGKAPTQWQRRSDP
jgi:hypothetical protein